MVASDGPTAEEPAEASAPPATQVEEPAGNDPNAEEQVEEPAPERVGEPVAETYEEPPAVAEEPPPPSPAIETADAASEQAPATPDEPVAATDVDEDQPDGGTDPVVASDGPTADEPDAPSTPPATEVEETAGTDPKVEEPVEEPSSDRVEDVVAETYEEPPAVAEEPPPSSPAIAMPDDTSEQAPATPDEAVAATEADEVAVEGWAAESYGDAPAVEGWPEESYGEAPAVEGEAVADDAQAAGAYRSYDDTDTPEAPAGAEGQTTSTAYDPAPSPPSLSRTPAPNRTRGPAARRSARADRGAPPPTVPAPTGAPAPGPGGTRWMVVLLSVLTVAVVALAIYAVSLSRRGDDDPAASPTTTVATRPVVTLPAGAFTNFRDDETGFTMRYPSAWQRYDAPVREIRLLVGDGPYSVRVRTRRTEEATTTQNLANVKAFADGNIAGPTVVVLQQDPVSLNGMIGFRYLYTFTDEDSGIQGAHLHYFLFQGHKMHDLIFQALPTETFTQIEGVFNQMLESFRSDPDPTGSAPGGSAPPTTTG